MYLTPSCMNMTHEQNKNNLESAWMYILTNKRTKEAVTKWCFKKEIEKRVFKKKTTKFNSSVEINDI